MINNPPDQGGRDEHDALLDGVGEDPIGNGGGVGGLLVHRVPRFCRPLGTHQLLQVKLC